MRIYPQYEEIPTMNGEEEEKTKETEKSYIV